MLGLWSSDKKTHEYQYIPIGTFLVIQSDIIHSGIFGFNGNSRLHVLLCCQNIKPKADSLRQFAGEASLFSIDWSTAYYFGMQQTCNFSEYNLQHCLNYFPLLNIVTNSNLLGDLESYNFGINSICFIEHI